MTIAAGGKKTQPKRLTMFTPLIGGLAVLATLYHPTSTWIRREKWDGFGPALSVAVSGPGEVSIQNPDAGHAQGLILLRRLLEEGKIEGKKFGRDWMVLSLDYQRRRAPKREKGGRSHEES